MHDTPIIIVCPLCKEPLVKLDNKYRCKHCRRMYPVVDGIPHLLSEIDDEFKAFQKKVYDESASETTPLQLAIDKRGFSYPTTSKLAKMKEILDPLNIFPNACLLDIGCGSGRILNKLAAQYQIQGFGIDISLNQLKANSKHNPFGHRYYYGDAEKLPFQDNTFDFITCFDVFEHLSHPIDCAKEICRTLKKKGKALVYVINKKEKYTWHWFLRKISGKKLGIDTGKFSDHRIENFLYSEEVIAYFHNANAKVEEIIYFDAFFTLAFNELQEAISTWYKNLITSNKDIKLFQENKRKEVISEINIPLSVILSAFMASIALKLLELLDKPWTSRGYSNGFFVLVQKRNGN